MSQRMRVFVELALAMAILAPIGSAQKPPAPPPTPPPTNPPSQPPGSTPSATPTTLQPMESAQDLVLFLRGRVAIGDGTKVPHDVIVERVCNAGVVQQVYASTTGDFSMQLGTRENTLLDASASGARNPQFGINSTDPNAGIPRRDLASCELRVAATGFQSAPKSLMDLELSNSSVDVGVLLMSRTSKIEGATLSATPYKAPKEAWKAFEKGLEAEKKNKFAEARKYFEQAVKIYPSYAIAWYELGTILQKEKQKEAARDAYNKAATIDFKFLPPFLSLASMAYEAGEWTDVLDLTARIEDLDPTSHASTNGYIVDFDRVNYTELYFYETVANFRLNKIAAAEKSGLKAEHFVDTEARFSEIHIYMAEIFALRNKIENAVSELELYLELSPHAENAGRVREQLARWKQPTGPITTKE